MDKWPFRKKIKSGYVVLYWALVGLMPALLVLNGVSLVMNESWLVTEYTRDTFPADEYGYSTQDRIKLSSRVLQYIKGHEGVASFKVVVGGVEPGFGDREILHLEDVRRLVTYKSMVHAGLGTVFVAGLVVLFVNKPSRKLVWQSVVCGGLWTMTLGVVAVMMMIFSWERFFWGFHQIFFAPGTWQFGINSSLLRLFPMRFWVDSVVFVLIVTAVQAIVAATIPNVAGWGKKK